MTPMEHLGKELARQVQVLEALAEEREEALLGFKLRKETIEKEIRRLAMDVRTGQSPLFEAKEQRHD